VSHFNAILAPAGRLKLAQCLARWFKRNVELGAAEMHYLPSRQLRCSHCSALRTEQPVDGLRTPRRLGPAKIAYHLHLNISTVHRILHCYHCPRLRFTILQPWQGSGRNESAAMDRPGPVK